MKAPEAIHDTEQRRQIPFAKLAMPRVYARLRDCDDIARGREKVEIEVVLCRGKCLIMTSDSIFEPLSPFAQYQSKKAPSTSILSNAVPRIPMSSCTD
jgi:hypothetical protein